MEHKPVQNPTQGNEGCKRASIWRWFSQIRGCGLARPFYMGKQMPVERKTQTEEKTKRKRQNIGGIQEPLGNKEATGEVTSREEV
ncbi:unnamed protein product [Cylicocyclus nassatus]|uniref:Uncharacterized protein n=1 Tax=Cylicocyclus nassatus TaxID=53992 RepID=A0AA36M4E9_CYLNA|nr:unnamed protein product [Cylicocyclus nassatus]